MPDYIINKDNIEKAKLLELDREILVDMLAGNTAIHPIRRTISGTYKNPESDSNVLELRVDVDGRRPQNRLSGDFFSDFFIHFDKWLYLKPIPKVPLGFKVFRRSFVVESVTYTTSNNVSTLTGQIKYYDDPSITNETIEVTIPRVSVFSRAPNANISIYKSGLLVRSYCSPKISEYFRTVELEIDRYQGTSFPPEADMNLSPSPADLPTGSISTEKVFKNAGIDMTVIEDDVLTDPDSDDAGSNWSAVELHQLMEDNFDKFSNSLQWNVYGVVVPRYGDPDYDSGTRGVMFDWGGYQTGDSYFRQGAAIFEDAILAHSVGTLYDTQAKQDRLILQIFCHEIGHAFNLPHTWQRTADPDSASESFMNYRYLFTGGSGGESQFWAHFRWEFDDTELIWMRHADRRDVIFGGNDWIGNNLSQYTEPQANTENAPLSLEIRASHLLSLGEPVTLELKLKNISSQAFQVVNRLQPEDQLVAIYIVRPNGQRVRYIPPVCRTKFPGDVVELAPGKALYETVMLSYGAKGPHFREPGEYLIRAYYGGERCGFIMSKSFRLRICAPHSRDDEELAHLMFDHRAAKFMYFKGGHRYPQMVSKLQEAVEKYGKSHPEIIRHVNMALGLNFARDYKRVIRKNGKRVISLVRSDNNEAIKHLSESLKIIPERGCSALDNITFNQISMRLIDCLQLAGRQPLAKSRLNDSLKYLESMSVISSVISEYKRRLKKMTEKD
ncbi:MAG: zinc metalloprotease [Planctomycetota bacterium]|jgi:hypothetical protein